MVDRILIGIVTYEGKSYCQTAFLRFLSSVTYPHADILFVDNSPSPANRDVLRKHKFNAVWIRKGRSNKEIMANCNEYLRQYTLEKHYSHLLSLESDIFPCPNFCELLLSYEKPVVGLPYFLGQSFMSYLLQFDSADYGYMRQLVPMSNAKSLFLANGRLKRSQQIGLGCLLIHRLVLKKVRFSIDEDYPGYHADSSLHLQLQKLNIPVYLAPDYYCRHDNKPHNIIHTEEAVRNSVKYKEDRS